MKPNKNNTVDKALSPEEMTILSNIQSLIQELVSMSGEKAQEPVKEIDDEEKEMEKADMSGTGKENKEDEYLKEKKGKVKKEIENTPGEGPDAMSSAEDNVDENLPESTKDNVDDVAKALASAINLTLKSRKETKKSVNPVIQTLSDLTETVKKNSLDIESISNAVAKVLQGLGVDEQLNIAHKSLQNSSSKPIINTDNDATLKFVVDLINKAKDSNMEEGNKKGTTYQKNADIINKNLSDKNVLKALVGVDR